MEPGLGKWMAFGRREVRRNYTFMRSEALMKLYTEVLCVGKDLEFGVRGQSSGRILRGSSANVSKIYFICLNTLFSRCRHT